MEIKKFNDYKVNEGTWSLPKDEKEQIEAMKYLVKIDSLKKELYDKLGDDILFDHLDGAYKRIEELIKLAPESKDWVGLEDKK